MRSRRELHLNLNPDHAPTVRAGQITGGRKCQQEVRTRRSGHANRGRGPGQVVRVMTQLIAPAASARRWMLSFSSTLCT